MQKKFVINADAIKGLSYEFALVAGLMAAMMLVGLILDMLF